MAKEKIKRYFTDLKNLLWPFKWYMAAYLVFTVDLIYRYCFPLAADDPSF